MTDWTKPDTSNIPAPFGIERGCVCVKCGKAAPCDKGELRDHRFLCRTCLDAPKKVGR
jgi:formylmethanofuran dehydrogenase subunit E